MEKHDWLMLLNVKQLLISYWLQVFTANHILTVAVNHDKMGFYFDVQSTKVKLEKLIVIGPVWQGMACTDQPCFIFSVFHIYMWRFSLSLDDVFHLAWKPPHMLSGTTGDSLLEVVTVQHFVSSQAMAKPLKLPWQQQMAINLLARADTPRLPRWVDQVLFFNVHDGPMTWITH